MVQRLVADELIRHRQLDVVQILVEQDRSRLDGLTVDDDVASSDHSLIHELVGLLQTIARDSQVHVASQDFRIHDSANDVLLREVSLVSVQTAFDSFEDQRQRNIDCHASLVGRHNDRREQGFVELVELGGAHVELDVEQGGVTVFVFVVSFQGTDRTIPGTLLSGRNRNHVHTFVAHGDRLQRGGQNGLRVSSQHSASDTGFDLSLAELVTHTQIANDAFQGGLQAVSRREQVVLVGSSDGFGAQGQELFGVSSGGHRGHAVLLQLGAELVQCQSEGVALIYIVEHAHV